jgi:hypothetical protein
VGRPIGPVLRREQGITWGDGEKDSSAYFDGHRVVLDLVGDGDGADGLVVRALDARNAPTIRFRVEKGGRLGFGAGNARMGSDAAGLYFSLDALGLSQPGSGQAVRDVWFDLQNQQLRVRKMVSADLDNPAQINGNRYKTAAENGGDGYTAENQTIGLGGVLLHIQAGGSVADKAGAGTQDVSLGGRIAFRTSQTSAWTTTSSPGVISLEPVPVGSTTYAQGAMYLDEGGDLTVGGGSAFPAPGARVALRANPGNASATLLRLMHDDDPAGGESGQQIRLSFSFRGQSADQEAGRILVGKDQDFTSDANSDSHMRFFVMLDKVVTEVLRASGTLFDVKVKLGTPASAAGGAGLNVAHGAAPSSPSNGDIWTTSSGLFVRINGVTVGPLS